LKTFRKGHEEVFWNERNAFYGLQNHQGMVRYIGDYEHRETEQSSPGGTLLPMPTTYNILLEWGDHDLRYLFEHDLPPVLETEVEEFWTELIEVADALEGMHNLRNGIDEEYHG
jgi:hypothetical protein